MSIVEIRNVAKHFDDVRAVDGINLQIQPGEFLVILGPSGCGKTTLMRLIAGLEYPTAGEIWIADQLVNDLPPRLRHIAMVFQSYALYPHMTVMNNIAFPLKAQQKELSKEAREAKVIAAARMVSIDHLLKRKPRQLSGGERQRVAIARALVTEPMVLLLDEPLSNLDAKLRAIARDELKEFQQRLGITTIFVTHDQIEAMGLGDRIVVMSQGKIQQVGTPEEIYTDPDNTFVATFLGSPSMNILPNEEFDLGFRPENFHPASTYSPGVPVENFVYHVKRIEYLGADRILYGYIEGYGEDKLILARMPVSVLHEFEVSQNYDFAVAATDLRYFDKDTGQRVVRMREQV
jgi:multiple sugar transport system ATP-binding protein